MKHFYLILSLLILIVFPERSLAFPADTYAENSVLASGRWVKISVPEDGLYILTPSRLRSWGFTDVSKVVVRGYGGRRQSDILSRSNYIDDLPIVQTVTTDRGIVFYGVGAGVWTESSQAGYYYYRQNDYSSAGYYFIGIAEDGEVFNGIEKQSLPLNGTPSETYMAFAQHELERVPVPGEAGPLLLGEDFRYDRSRTISFDITDAVGGGRGWFLSSFVSNMSSAGASLSFTVGSEAIPTNSSFRISATTGEHVNGSVNLGRASFSMPETPGARLDIAITLNASTTPKAAYLNYLALNYERHLRIPSSGYLCFSTADRSLSLDVGGKTPVVWDVTDPMDIVEVDYGALAGSKASWTALTTRRRSYAAWIPGASIPEPTLIGTVSNQNLHALSDLDMVIVAPSAYTDDARRIADMHASGPDSLKVAVVTPDAIYNEFSSGTLDPGGIRRFFKMLYDRGSDSIRPLRYAILMARTTLDNRRLTAGERSGDRGCREPRLLLCPTIPVILPTTSQQCSKIIPDPVQI